MPLAIDELRILQGVLDQAVDHHGPSLNTYNLAALANTAAPVVARPNVLEGLLSDPLVAAALQAAIMGLIAKVLAGLGPKAPPAPAPPVVVPNQPTPPSAPPVNPAPGDARVFPDEVELKSISAFHPTHGDLGKCPISADGVISPPPALGTSDFDDNTDFVLEVGYKLKGAGIHFDNTPNATHLKRTARYEFRNSGRSGAVARLDATRLESGGFMADGGQIRKRYDETQGMDPTIKFPPKPHGPNGGEVVTLDIFAPDGGGDEVGRRYTFAPFN